MPAPPVSLPMPRPLVEGRLVARPNRFLAEVELSGGERVAAHVPDPGRLADILVPERRLWLQHRSETGRRTAWTALLAEAPEGGIACLDAQLPNRLVHRALEARALTELADWTLERREPRHGRSRFDFALQNEAGRRLLLEVKGVTMVEGDVAFFPDAVTARGSRHLRELACLARAGEAAAVLFVVQRPAQCVAPAAHIDADFAAALAEAAVAGVGLYARRALVALDAVRLGEALPVVADPG